MKRRFHCKRTSGFARLFPGPYTCVTGRDGVDETFDVFCVTSERWMLATYFSDDRDEAKLTAGIICDALNLLALGETFRSQIEQKTIRRFQAIFPGPFASRRTCCDYRCPGYEVTCQSSGECVVFNYNLDFRGHARLVSHQVARSLNALFETNIPLAF